MTKITLDRETFKALASDTRLDILKTLDGKNMGLNEIAKVSNLNKATLHEHLTKLHEAGLIKRTERDGHKWVYYKLTWKGESLLHPENIRIVVLFATTFVALWVGVIQLIWYIKGTVVDYGYNLYRDDGLMLHSAQNAMKNLMYNSPSLEGSAGGFPAGFSNPLQMFVMKLHLISGSGTPSTDEFKILEQSMLTTGEGSRFVMDQNQGIVQVVSQNPIFLYIAMGCFVLFTVILCVALWRLWENRSPKL